MRTKPCLTAADVKEMMAAGAAEAEKNKWKVAIAIVDDGGFLLHLDRMDGAAVTTAEVATGKARTSRSRGGPARISRSASRSARPSHPPSGRPVHPGCGPIIHDNECVGAIGVSGVQSLRRRADRARRYRCLELGAPRPIRVVQPPRDTAMVMVSTDIAKRVYDHTFKLDPIVRSLLDTDFTS
jgi:uncharacterized protein GlcG (DUF336 family)